MSSPPATLGGVTFTTVTGQIDLSSNPGISIVGDRAACAATDFYFAFPGEGNGGGILAGLPGGVTAFSANAGDVYNFFTVCGNASVKNKPDPAVPSRTKPKDCPVLARCRPTNGCSERIRHSTGLCWN